MTGPVVTPPAETARHISVLLHETLHYLAPRPGGRYLDGTLGLGGHGEAVLRAAPDCELLGLDRDEEALALAGERLAPFGGRAHLRHSAFRDFAVCLDEMGWDKVDGALVDLGVSSMQLDTPERGFSFMHDGPLDMRMDRSGEKNGRTASASALVNKASYETLKDIIASAGEEPQAGRIARAIVEARAKKPIEGTLELAALVERAYPAKWRATARNHPATRTFQALRMAVNSELDQLSAFLAAALPRLAPGGRLVVISFHSLEDRIVKNFFRDEAQDCRCPRHIPVCICRHTALLRILTKKPVTPGADEIAANPRAGSAKLRAAERLQSGAAARAEGA